ncbi:unnamed protein product [Enterobius vermicularis]|uniref:ABC transmembrane type-1 domain-containing protein n=1 Tax=Enterobius vermicularis TaxID=51028 RepID=A0A0N4VPS8_ENTVE|nr:unnamed protein product [Enterobius vermicularis]
MCVCERIRGLIRNAQKRKSDESLSMCGSLNEDGGRESVLSDGQTGANGNKRKVPKVFSKDAVTKFRAWLFQNLTNLCTDTVNASTALLLPMLLSSLSLTDDYGGKQCLKGITIITYYNYYCYYYFIINTIVGVVFDVEVDDVVK